MSNGATTSGIYRHYAAVEGMLQWFTRDHSQIQQNVEKANSVSIVSDESIDIAILKETYTFHISYC